MMNFNLTLKASISDTSQNTCFYFMIGFLWSFIHIQYFSNVMRNKFQTVKYLPE